ncbi:protein O-mannosyl-transferase family [candidate division KSB1 bacterium]
MKEKEHVFCAVFTFLASLVVYLVTIARTVSLWDCGEFITSSATLGVPHPPGAPLYLLVGRLFSLLPLGSDIAYRVNLISALSSALTVMILYLIIVRLIKEYYGAPAKFEQKLVVYGGAVIGALTFAFTDTFWFNATESEVYALSMLLTSLSLYLALLWMDQYQEASSLRLLLLCFYLFGLAVGVHLLNLLVIPSIIMLTFFYDRDLFNSFLVIGLAGFFALVFSLMFDVPRLVYFLFPCFLLVAWVINKDMFSNAKFWGLAAFMLFLGFTTYLLIYIRANLGPFLNENDPSTLERFMSYWNREQYGEESLFLTVFDRQAPFWTYQIKKMYLRYFAWNFMGKGTTIGPDGYITQTFWNIKGLLYMPFLLGVTGMYFHFKRDWKRALAILIMFIVTGLALVIYLNQPDPQPRERDYVYVGSFFAFAIWIGIGVSAIFDYVMNLFKDSGARNIIFGTVFGLCIVAGPLIEFNHNFHVQDRRGNYFASDYSYNILQSCEENAIMFTNGDNDTFPLWYLQAIEGVRTDVAIVNLSLLNTDWYIKQLKYGNPIYDPVPISLTDEQIEFIQPQPWQERQISVPVPKDVYNAYNDDVYQAYTLEDIEADTSLILSVKPTFLNQYLRVQDFMIINIIYANQWRRPIYFAMTVSDDNKVGLRGNLRIDGMAFKLVPFASDNYAVDVLRNNLLNEYRYRGFNDPDVYYNIQKIDLFQNLRTCFLIAADIYSRNNDHEKAMEILDAHDAKMPEEVIPVRNFQTSARVAQMYIEAGRNADAMEKLEKLILRNDVDDNVVVEIVQLMWFRLNENDRAVELLREIIGRQPDMARAYMLLLEIFKKNKSYSDAIVLLNTWILRHPEDQSARTRLEEFRTLAAQADTTIR